MKTENAKSGVQENRPGNISKDPVLPPLEKETASSGSEPPVQGISPNLKRGILIFSIFTVLAFGVFGTLLIKKLLSRSTGETSPRNHELLTVAERLESAGLYDQALGQYEKFLNANESNPKLRAEAAYKAGKLYVKLDNCRDGLVLLFHSQAIQADAPWTDDLNATTDACIARLKPHPNP